MFGRKKRGTNAKQTTPQEGESAAGTPDASAESGPTRSARGTANWRLIYNPQGDPVDVVAYGAAVAEGRIAGKYQLSNTRVPNTVIIQRSTTPGVIAGADVKVDRQAAKEAGISIARTQRQGRNSARTVGTINLSELMTRSSKSFEAAEVEPDSPAVVLYTSGTTGNPKGVTLTHRNFHFQLSTVVPSLVDFKPSDRVIGVLPMYHVFGLANSMVAAIHNGATICLVPQYSPANLLSAINEYQGTILPAVPSMYQHLLAIARARKAQVPDSLRMCVSGGAALPLAVVRQFAETFGAQILEGYGLTETVSSVSVNGKDGQMKEGSIGRPADGVEMQIVDDAGAPVAPGASGEIAIRSTTVFQGYWNNADATAEVMRDGWFLTGDLGYQDEDGFFFITDRKKDIIITGGYNVSPREIEEVLMTIPQVADAAVVGMPGRKDQSETITAFVVLYEGEELSHREIMEYCDRELATYKRPKVVNFVETLPKNATGKVLRNELRGEAVDRRLVERAEPVEVEES
ncbi:MAG: AMP-binding protein [Alkalispirochaeta sp.]